MCVCVCSLYHSSLETSSAVHYSCSLRPQPHYVIPQHPCSFLIFRVGARFSCWSWDEGRSTTVLSYTRVTTHAESQKQKTKRFSSVFRSTNILSIKIFLKLLIIFCDKLLHKLPIETGCSVIQHWSRKFLTFSISVDESPVWKSKRFPPQTSDHVRFVTDKTPNFGITLLVSMRL